MGMAQRHSIQRIVSRYYSTTKHIKPRRDSPSIHYNNANKPKKSESKTYKSSQKSRSVRLFNKISNVKSNELADMMSSEETSPFNHINLSKKQRKKLKKHASQQDISANFPRDNSTQNEIHGIVQMFDDQQQSDMNDNEYWYNNPDHIDQIEQFLTQKKLPFNDINSDLNVSYLTDNVSQTDNVRINNRKLSKRMQLKINRKLKTKERGNDENMNKNELIQRNEIALIDNEWNANNKAL